MHTARLDALTQACAGASVVADVGCDHGYLVALLAEKPETKHIFALDISPLSLAKTERLVREKHLEPLVTCLVSNGLQALDGLVAERLDAVVIAGVGADEIISIVSLMPKSLEVGKIIVNSVQDVVKYKYRIMELGWRITRDRVIKDAGKFYHIVTFEKGQDEKSVADLTLGDYENTSDYFEYLHKKKASLLRRAMYAKDTDAEVLEKINFYLGE